MVEENAQFLNMDLDLDERVEDLLARLTLKEKFQLCSGGGWWQTNAINRLGIPSMGVSDGPHGLAFHSSGFKRNTFFSSLICLGATWNPDLAMNFGKCLGQETRACNKQVILGPGLNIHRSPLCGRTFEYLTEDPYLNAHLAVAIVKGIQSQRVAACIKHFVANNQESNRFYVDAIISERALEEIYFPAFKAAVTQANAWTVMACYNSINGKYGVENEYLLKEKLRDDWGFKGFVMSDWMATGSAKSTQSCMNGGLTLEMPGFPSFRKRRFTKRALTKSYKKGEFSLETLDENIRRLLKVIFLVGLFDEPESLPQGARNTKEHQNISRKIAEEGMVLLKNENNILPLDGDEIKTIAIIGPNVNKKTTWLFYGGSSAVWPPHEITPKKGISEWCKGKIKIIKDISKADYVIFVGGLNHNPHNDSEGSDRKQLELPKKQINKIKKTVQKNPNTIVVLVSGSPVAMSDWINNTAAVIQAWYGGMEAGHALAGILFGDVNPSGKLPTTFPKKLKDSPAHASKKTFPGNKKVYYEEGIFVGYRHFDKENIEPLFPFGFGLSYTQFEFSNLNIKNKETKMDEEVNVSVDIKNVGKRAGAEIVQVYVTDDKCTVQRPNKELKGFSKVFLKPGEQQTIEISLDESSFSFFNENDGKWAQEPGSFTILIGNSSRDIKLKEKLIRTAV